MLYARRSFTLPVSEGNRSMCDEKGHSAKDAHGRCLCCGDKIGPSMAETVASFNTARRPYTPTCMWVGNEAVACTAVVFDGLRSFPCASCPGSPMVSPVAPQLCAIISETGY